MKFVISEVLKNEELQENNKLQIQHITMANPTLFTLFISLFIGMISSKGQVYTHTPIRQSKDLFNLKISYEEQLNGNQINHAGNISSLEWRTKQHEGGYMLQYDDLNQLIEADHFHRNNNTIVDDHQYELEMVQYDLDGNIERLKRTDATEQGMDDLTYTYQKSRLHKIEELGDLSNGFVTNTSQGQYQYDLNGNLIRDDHKEVSIFYNSLDLPYLFVFDSGDSIKIQYLATGKKFKKRINQITKDYTSIFEYVDGVLESAAHNEGRSTFLGNGQFQNEFAIKDHLGNTRVLFADIDNNNKIDPNTELLQEKHYYPFGLTMEGNWDVVSGTSENKYQYSGKELNDENGLSWMDYGARWYDPAIGRWNSVDPLAEEFISYSPYNYVLNNPTLLIDPDGRAPTIFTNESGEIIAETKDGSDDVYVIEDEKQDRLVEELRHSIDLGVDDDKDRNSKLGEKYGSRQYTKPYDFKGLENCNLCINETSISPLSEQPWWKKLTYTPGGPTKQDAAKAMGALGSHRYHNGGAYWKISRETIEKSKGNLSIMIGSTLFYLQNSPSLFTANEEKLIRENECREGSCDQ
ncbi:MAG: RHS repeat-associated core domain-containing protein [Flavobacteriales bacterium]|nr:RHS repeat-associated core domain-containing protein [Flavobacteriales bacterium]